MEDKPLLEDSSLGLVPTSQFFLPELSTVTIFSLLCPSPLNPTWLHPSVMAESPVGSNGDG